MGLCLTRPTASHAGPLQTRPTASQAHFKQGLLQARPFHSKVFLHMSDIEKLGGGGRDHQTTCHLSQFHGVEGGGGGGGGGGGLVVGEGGGG